MSNTEPDLPSLSTAWIDLSHKQYGTDGPMGPVTIGGILDGNFGPRTRTQLLLIELQECTREVTEARVVFVEAKTGIEADRLCLPTNTGPSLKPEHYTRIECIPEDQVKIVPVDPK